MCPEKHIIQSLSVQFNFQNCNKCVLFPFTLHSSSEESFLKGFFFLFKEARACSQNTNMCKYGNLLIKELNKLVDTEKDICINLK